MATIKVGEIKYDDDFVWESSVDIALDTAAELNIMAGSENFQRAKDLLLMSSLTMLAGSALASVTAMSTKVAASFLSMDLGNTKTSSLMMVSDYLNNESTMNMVATAGTVGVIGTVAALSVKSLVSVINDVAIKLDPTLISKRQTLLAEAYGEVFAFGEKHRKDRSKHNIDESYEKIRPIAEKIGFEGDRKGDHVIYEWLSKVTNEPMSPNDLDAPKILNTGKGM
ncbi:hypothetical protein HNW13_018300 [Shewanella sp. BF02_Schw]|uniref:hypothetical protein n=1 Tax=Shewanella sp. BF02_Schw TaxID=394908 RepID=UPI001784FBA0|nr:hypothetical protein [Shewanella sp. BF02_Schw]MBO1897693.1 hypothetical protein [Shewanella sp. BF02_Schw]